jgi:hypothetical protein
MTARPGAQSRSRSRARAAGCYLWQPPNYAAASVAVQSRWGNLYDGQAAIRSLAVNVDGDAHVLADIAAPAAGPVADRLPGGSLRLRVPDVPAPPFRGRCRVLLSLGEVTELVSAHVALVPGHGPAADDLRVLISAAAPGEMFGLTRAQASRPPNVVRRASRAIHLLVDATVTTTVDATVTTTVDATVTGDRGR